MTGCSSISSTPYYAVIKKARDTNPKVNTIMGGDAVHPGPAGQSVMAASILKGLSSPRSFRA